MRWSNFCTWDAWALKRVGKRHTNLSHAVTFQQRVTSNLLPAQQCGKRESSRARNHQPGGRRESTPALNNIFPTFKDEKIRTSHLQETFQEKKIFETKYKKMQYPIPDSFFADSSHKVPDTRLRKVLIVVLN